MSLLFKNLAKYVAKILSIIMTIFIFVVVVYGQKVDGKVKASPTPTPTISPIAEHRRAHRGTEWWQWEGFDNIILSSIPLASSISGGTMSYSSLNVKGENSKTIKWDTKTVFQVMAKEDDVFAIDSLKNKCFLIIYCKRHNLALYLEEQTCSEKK